MSLDLASTLAALPPLRSEAKGYRAQVQALLAQQQQNAVVPLLVALDDDPTGTQTCHDINVLTVWDVDTLTAEFQAAAAAAHGFFILTNSRALHPDPARALIAAICRNLQAASAATGVPFEIVLRGDSTLRGHFPLEPEAAESVLGAADAWILCPFFLQGGRYTINDVHYVAEAGAAAGKSVLVPAAATPFAQDATFGYRSSNLRDYVVEKTGGAIPASRVTSLSLDTIRTGGPDAILAQLLALPTDQRTVVVNAAAEEDVDAVVLALLRAASGSSLSSLPDTLTKPRKYLFRTGAAFVSARLGIAPIAPISASALGIAPTAPISAGGLVIAGSYVPKTTAQLAVLRAKSGDKLTTVELDVNELLRPSSDAATTTIQKAIAVAEQEITRGQDVLVMTSRALVVGADEAASLDIGSTVAAALVSFLQQLQTRPRYVVAKGGITSSDMATKGLRFRRARVVGQAAPGVPLWRCDEATSKWPGVAYVVFPGNVGSDETLYEVVNGWRP